ncbi:hypothetical protein Taro_004632 [Colocasia esculenta]|uniref:Non-specific lipid-transfer protein n=1 Tax=Colocasia esculenta TaxID=4460 RepID=A0A843TMX7_COLES|nr:hypothetical protein [Colocasia esculenta]
MKGGLLLCAALAALAVAQLLAVGGAAAAINCVEVDLALRPCVPYLVGAEAEPGPGCCAGVLSVKNMATTTADKRAACGCVKAAAAHLQGLKDSAVSALPAKCNAPLPYPISTNFDCNHCTVQFSLAEVYLMCPPPTSPGAERGRGLGETSPSNVGLGPSSHPRTPWPCLRSSVRMRADRPAPRHPPACEMFAGDWGAEGKGRKEGGEERQTGVGWVGGGEDPGKHKTGGTDAACLLLLLWVGV